jgi:sulfate adenylyltransferase
MENKETLIKPHGGQLVQRTLSPEKRGKVEDRIQQLKKIVVNQWTISDIELIANGAFSPLTGFMNQSDYESVLDHYRLTSGIAWTIPVTLAIDENIAHSLKTAEEVALVGEDSTCYALLTVEEVYRFDPREEAKKVYLTTDLNHPGVAKLMEKPRYYLAGPINLVQRPARKQDENLYLDPIETRKEFSRRGWKAVVGFQTRNPIHRAHEYIQKCALETVDGLLLHPLVGETKKDDVPADIRVESYRILLDNYYPKERVLFSIYPAAMRYAGPREAVFHAIVRKNYGCSHFVVGRDHAGVGDYYGPYDSQKIFDQFSKDELEIQPYFFEQSFFCNRCNSMASEKTCPHVPSDRVLLSGTKVRAMLREGELPPKEITRPEVAHILAEGLKEK